MCEVEYIQYVVPVMAIIKEVFVVYRSEEFLIIGANWLLLSTGVKYTSSD